jgi:hypothetical protein
VSANSAELYAAYEEHSKTLRTWLVAYGVGVPVVLLSNDRIWTAVTQAGLARSIGALFLSGVALQVFLAALNKSVMWACYYAEANPGLRKRRRFRVADWFSEQFLIDFAVDVATLVLFAVATLRTFRALIAIS